MRILYYTTYISYTYTPEGTVSLKPAAAALWNSNNLLSLSLSLSPSRSKNIYARIIPNCNITRTHMYKYNIILYTSVTVYIKHYVYMRKIYLIPIYCTVHAQTA